MESIKITSIKNFKGPKSDTWPAIHKDKIALSVTGPPLMIMGMPDEPIHILHWVEREEKQCQ